ncbi:MAG TPA: hypothetical protein VID27_22085 [Blastocatellia bacterium]
MNNDYSWSNSPYSGSGVASQTDSPSEVIGLFINTHDRSEYIEFNHDGTFLQYERNAQFLGRYSLDGGVLRMAFSDGRTAKILVERYSFTDQQGRIWMKKERTRSSAPLAPIPTSSQPASRSIIIWASVIIAAAVFIIVATQWSNIEKWLRTSSPIHYSESKAEWKIHSFPGTGMTVDLPDDPVPYSGEPRLKEPLPDYAAMRIKEKKAYLNKYENFGYVLVYAEYETWYVADVEAMGRELKNMFEGKKIVASIEYKITTLDPDRASISGTCRYLGVVVSVNGLIQAKDHRVWIILTISRKSDEEAQAAAKRILTSARFE